MDDTAPERLAGRWPLPVGESVRDALLTAYGDPARRYHDRLHLREVLDRLEELDDVLGHDQRLAVRLAAWFHDAVYTGAPDDEERSAALAATELGALEVDPRTVDEVVRLVRLTAEHRPEPGDLPGQVLSDADLAVLAAPADRYQHYCAGVRAEYAHVPDHAFRSGRAAVLAGLLAKPTLFHTDRAREAWEERARANVAAELRRLTAAPAPPG